MSAALEQKRWLLPLEALVLLALAVALAVSAAGDLAYSLRREPVEVATPQDAERLAADRYVSLRAPLDEASSLVVYDSEQQRYVLLAPVAGTGGRLIFAAFSRFPVDADHRGRTLAHRFLQRTWALQGSTVDVVAQLGRKRFKVPADALVLLGGDLPRFDPWATVRGLLALLFLAAFLVRIGRAVRG